MRRVFPALLVFLLTIFYSLHETTAQSEFVKVTDIFRHRVKREVREDGSVNLGDPVPDWSDVVLDGNVRYLQALIVVDAQVADYYGGSMDKIKAGVTDLLLRANLYLYQLDLRLTVVDVTKWNRYNASLEEFLAYRNSIAKDLPEHDFAFLMSYHYYGGVAYVNGVCGYSAVGVCGFFPENPVDYAGVFFHELAHLLGMGHDDTTTCKCNADHPPGSCLKIDGYTHDCSTQRLADRLKEAACIQTLPEKLVSTTVPMCGNGVKEDGEQCDCGPEKYCRDWNCRPLECRQKISDFLQHVIIFFAVCAAIAIASLAIYYNYVRPYQKRHTKRPRIGRNLSSVKIEQPALAKDVKLQPIRVAPSPAPIRAAPAPPVPARPPNAAIQNAVGNQNNASIQKVRPEISAPVATIVASKKVTPEIPARPDIIQSTLYKPAVPPVHSKPALPALNVREIIEAKETSLNGEQKSVAYNKPKTPDHKSQPSSPAVPWKPKPNSSGFPKPPAAALKPKLLEKVPTGLPLPPSNALKPKPALAVKPQRQQSNEEEERIYDVPSEREEDAPAAAVNNLVKLFEASKAAQK